MVFNVSASAYPILYFYLLMRDFRVTIALERIVCAEVRIIHSRNELLAWLNHLVLELNALGRQFIDVETNIRGLVTITSKDKDSAATNVKS